MTYNDKMKKAIQAELYKRMAQIGKDDRERLLVSMSMNPETPAWMYLFAETIHISLCQAESKPVVINFAALPTSATAAPVVPAQNQVADHRPAAPSTPGLSVKEWNAFIRRRNRIGAVIAIAMFLGACSYIALTFDIHRFLITLCIVVPIGIATFPYKSPMPKRSDFF